MLITNGQIVTMDSAYTILQDGAVRIEKDRITDIGTTSSLCAKFPDEPATNAEGMLVMPGNICGHTHFYGAFSRGLGIPGKPPAHFEQILSSLWWRLDKALTPDGVRSSALVCLVDAIRNGTTTLIDHHASPSCIDGSLDLIADAVCESGLRVCLCYEVTDRNGQQEMLAGIRENLRFIDKCKRDRLPMLAGTFGMHASLTLSDKTLARCSEEIQSQVCGVHIHAAEGIADQIDSVKKSGVRVIKRLNAHGLLGHRSILAHCVQVDEEELQVLAETGSRVTHQPRSNMNNAVGTAPVDLMLEMGIPVSMGNDGFSNNMWDEWKAAYLVHKLNRQDPRAVQGFDVLRMGVTNNALLAREFWPDTTLGTVQPGASADLVLVDYRPFTPLTSGNLPWHILFGLESGMIHSTMSRGKWLMQNRELTELDEERVIREARLAAGKVWERFMGKGDRT